MYSWNDLKAKLLFSHKNPNHSYYSREVQLYLINLTKNLNLKSKYLKSASSTVTYLHLHLVEK